MHSDERQSTRSPTTSRSDSYRDGPTPRANGNAYQTRSSITEENGKGYNEYEETVDDVDDPPANVRPPQRSEDQYIAALRYRFPNRPKTDYAYSKPLGPSGIFNKILFKKNNSFQKKNPSSSRSTFTDY